MIPTKPAYLQSTPLTVRGKSLLPFLRSDTVQRMVDVVLAMVSAESVTLSKLAVEMPGESSLEAKKRRAERGVHDPQLTLEVFVILLVALLPPGKLLLSMDRTFLGRTAPMRTLARNWEHGESPLNLLVLGAVVHGYTIPLVWIALDDDGGPATPGSASG